MAIVRVYGASDDLLEIDGDFSEEFSSYDRSLTVRFSEGTVIKLIAVSTALDAALSELDGGK